MRIERCLLLGFLPGGLQTSEGDILVILKALGRILGPLGALWGPLGRILGGSWDNFEGKLEVFGEHFRAWRADLMRLVKSK